MNFHSPGITDATATLTDWSRYNHNRTADGFQLRMMEDNTRSPAYPKFGTTVAKYRKLPRTPENVAAHAEALFSQLASLQRSEFKKATSEPTSAAPCASRTWHSDGKKILAAVNSQNRAVCANALAESWRKRTDAQVGIAYEAAMRGEDTPLTTDIYVPKADQPKDEWAWKRGRR